MVNAEIDKSVFSTVEKRIGTWIDGKPLYRKTFIQANSNVISLSVLNFSKLFVTQNSYAKVSNGTIFPLQYGIGTTNYINAFYNSSTGNMQFEVAGYTISELVLTIEYTKATD